jgi:hypothetical protein
MKVLVACFGFLITSVLCIAQFAPPVGQPGCTAIFKDSALFTSWATGCTINRGYRDISNQTLGYATYGDSIAAIGLAGTNDVVSLGDAGEAVLTFANPITNGVGWDFAVFENGTDVFLELAFVEVSSDGINYFRFQPTSYTQDTLQVSGFGNLDATKIDNLAGKYRSHYGTPFDLQQLSSQQGLNINAITHVKVIDIVGCIQTAYATFDQYGNAINDPWSTPFASCGFDLDAVGVIHTTVSGITNVSYDKSLLLFPNPSNEILNIVATTVEPIRKLVIVNHLGQTIKCMDLPPNTYKCDLNTSALLNGIYFVTLTTNTSTFTQKCIINHD